MVGGGSRQRDLNDQAYAGRISTQAPSEVSLCRPLHCPLMRAERKAGPIVGFRMPSPRTAEKDHCKDEENQQSQDATAKKKAEKCRNLYNTVKHTERIRTHTLRTLLVPSSRSSSSYIAPSPKGSWGSWGQDFDAQRFGECWVVGLETSSVRPLGSVPGLTAETYAVRMRVAHDLGLAVFSRICVPGCPRWSPTTRHLEQHTSQLFFL